MRLVSDAIRSDGRFDPRYTCDFDNSSPELRWSDAPEGVDSFVVIAEEAPPGAPRRLDAPAALSHWIVHSVPASISHLPAGIPSQEILPNGIRQGINGFGKLGYSGPCPPADGRAHRYVVRLHALRATPDIPPRVTVARLLEIIAPFVMATAEVFGTYRNDLRRTG